MARNLEGDEFVGLRPTGLDVTQEGTCLHVDTLTNVDDPEVVRQVAAEMTGVDPNDVYFRSDPEDMRRARKAGRASVFFGSSRWNSPWNPEENKNVNPTLN